MKATLLKSCYLAAAVSLFYACSPEEQSVKELDKISSSEKAMTTDMLSFDNGVTRTSNFVTTATTDGGAIIGIRGIQRSFVPNWSPANPGEYSAENRANLFNTNNTPVSVPDATIPGGSRISDDGDLDAASNTGNAFIINHNSRYDVPDDWAWGGAMYVDFSALGTVTLKNLVFLDNEENGTYIKLFNASNMQIGANIPVANLGNASSQVVNLGNTPGVARMEVHLGTTSVTGSGAIDNITFDREIPETGCTKTQGYWKTHSKYDGAKKYDDTWKKVGEDTPFFTSGETYYSIFGVQPRGNSYYSLAHQYIATKLNLATGATAPTSVMTAYNSATTFFTNNTPAAVAASKTLQATATQLAGILDAYNNGVTGPGHCD
ncbi:hypothetical protein AAE02nite_27860 [Adhaeribacter aerolatus]|uniref:Uncharacterized protein n=1 Tax=Adhaeribacter aerolatus TaxID=670289 RepID=A0A512AZI3_9BACT|nr:hypothetical protein [Adhaeribacter aerolatus]GEO05122.1 hypothetical protein AAE02nite_27860 [Adhaeribacter aerolatus]